MARLLVTGASGLLGANLLLAARASHQLIAASRRQRIVLAGAECVQVDLAQPGAAHDLLRDTHPDAVIHCAAFTDVDACEGHPELAERLNAEVPGWLAEACAREGTRLIHISTDAVFDGERGGYTEDDQPLPINVYGATKLRGEQAVLTAFPSATVIRTNIFGWNAQPKLGLAEWFVERLRLGERCTGFTDVTFSPLAVDDLAAGLLNLLSRSSPGVLHIAGTETVSKYDFGRRVAAAFGLPAERIVPGSVDASPLRARRPHKMTLDVRRAEAALDAPMPRLEPGLRRWREQEVDGTLDRLRALIDRRQHSAAGLSSPGTQEAST
jgi:dTDP-4-dehydrorhamnose reductase